MKLKTENREYRSDVFSMLMEVRKNMTLDMTFEAREKMIRRDEFDAGEKSGKAAGKAEEKEIIFLNMLSHGFDITDAIDITGISKERAEELVAAK